MDNLGRYLSWLKRRESCGDGLKSEPSIQLRDRFKQLRSETKKLIRSNYRKYIVKLSESLKDNPSRFTPSKLNLGDYLSQFFKRE